MKTKKEGSIIRTYSIDPERYQRYVEFSKNMGLSVSAFLRIAADALIEKERKKLAKRGS